MKHQRHGLCRLTLLIGIVGILLFGSFPAKAEFVIPQGATLEQLQWMEHKLLLRRAELLDEVRDQSVIFLRTPTGRLTTVDKNKLFDMIDKIGFVAAVVGYENFASPELQASIDALKVMGMWSDRAAPAYVKAAIQVESDKARSEAQQRIRAEFDPAIEAVRNRAAQLLAPPVEPVAEAGELEGVWAGCDGREVRFVSDGAGYQGYYTKLGGLGKFGFRTGDLGYTAKETGPGTYEGQVLWRWTDDRSEWRANKIKIKGGAYTDSASDGCSNKMTRIATD